MKNAVKLLFLFMVAVLAPNLASAQPPPVVVDNQTTCDYFVKANVTTTGGCPTGVGPTMLCPATTFTTMIATPPPPLQVVAFGAALPGGVTPVLAGEPTCGFPRVVTLPAVHPNACAGVVTTFVYNGKVLVIL